MTSASPEPTATTAAVTSTAATAANRLPESQQDALVQAYHLLHPVAAGSPSPAAQAGARTALAELYAVLEGEALHVEYYSHRWVEPNEAARHRDRAGSGEVRP